MHYKIYVFFLLNAFSVFAFGASANEVDLEVSPPLNIGISVEMDGYAKKCFLDTGSFATMVREKDFNFLGYEAIWEAEIGGIQTEKSRTVDGIEIEILKISPNWQVKKIPVLKMPKLIREMGWNNCVLGNDAFLGSRILFDFKSKKLKFLEPNEIQKGLSIERMIISNNRVLIPVKTGTIKALAMWDTGVSSMALVSYELIKENPNKFKFTGEIRKSTNADGVSHLQFTYILDELIIGDKLLRNILVTGANLSRQGDSQNKIEFILGLPMIVNYSWYFDYPNLYWSVY